MSPPRVRINATIRSGFSWSGRGSRPASAVPAVAVASLEYRAAAASDRACAISARAAASASRGGGRDGEVGGGGIARRQGGRADDPHLLRPSPRDCRARARCRCPLRRRPRTRRRRGPLVAVAGAAGDVAAPAAMWAASCARTSASRDLSWASSLTTSAELSLFRWACLYSMADFWPRSSSSRAAIDRMPRGADRRARSLA